MSLPPPPNTGPIPPSATDLQEANVHKKPPLPTNSDSDSASNGHGNLTDEAPVSILYNSDDQNNASDHLKLSRMYVRTGKCLKEVKFHSSHPSCCEPERFLNFMNNMVPTMFDYHRIQDRHQRMFYDFYKRIQQEFPIFEKLNRKSLNFHPKFLTSTNEHNQISCNILSIEDIEKLLPEDGPYEAHQLSSEQLKAKLINLHYISELLDTMLVALKKGDQNDEDIKNAVTKAQNRETYIQKLLKSTETQLTRLRDLKNLHIAKLKSPNLGDQDTFNIEHARLAIPSFDATSKSVSLQEFWNKISNFAKRNKLSEIGIKGLFETLLNGQPYQVFYDNQDKNLDEVVKALSDRFGMIQTQADKLHLLETIKRAENESLASVMQRVSTLIDQTNSSYPENQRETRRSLMMSNYLLQLCSKKARDACSFQRSKMERSGIILEYEQLFQICQDVENTQGVAEATADYFSHTTDLKSIPKYGNLRQMRRTFPYSKEEPTSPYKRTPATFDSHPTSHSPVLDLHSEPDSREIPYFEDGATSYSPNHSPLLEIPPEPNSMEIPPSINGYAPNPDNDDRTTIFCQYLNFEPIY